MNSESICSKVWTAIRKLNHFMTAEIIQLIGEQHKSVIKHYISTLNLTGYIRQINKNKKTPIYQLIRDSGIKHPIVYYAIYDPNTDLIYTKLKKEAKNENKY